MTMPTIRPWYGRTLVSFLRRVEDAISLSPNGSKSIMVSFWLIVDEDGRVWDGSSFIGGITPICAFMESLYTQKDMQRIIAGLYATRPGCGKLFLAHVVAEEVFPVREVAPATPHAPKGG